MNQKQWDSLSEGDLIRHKHASEGYTVMGNYRSYGVLLARNTLAHNPREWDLVAKASYSYEETDTPSLYPSFREFMDRAHGTSGGLVVQALAMLSTTEEFGDLTPEHIYGVLMHNFKEVEKQTT